MNHERSELESEFDIDKVSFKNVSKEFERKFRESYERSLKMMSDNRNNLENSSGANSLKMLERMALLIDNYDTEDGFEDSYYKLLKEYEPFTET